MCVGLAASGCSTPSRPNAAAQPAFTPSPGKTGPAFDSDDCLVEWAWRGLQFESDVAEVDPRTAAEVVPNPDPSIAPDEEAIGRHELDLHRVCPAVSAFTRSIINAPTRASAYEGLSEALLRAKKTPEMIAACRSAILLDPELNDARVRMAIGLQLLADVRAAADAWRDVLSYQPSHPEAHGRLAVLLYYLGDFEQAILELQAAEAEGHTYPAQLWDLLRDSGRGPH